MKREIVNRYDFKNTNTSIDFSNYTISLKSSTEERLKAADQVLREKFVKRNVSIKFLSNFTNEQTPSESKRMYRLKSGIDKEISKNIVKDLKEFSKKLQSSIQNESIRVSSKKRDELQEAITFLKRNNYNVHLNYGNFRD
jgi:hypothetical protein